MLCTFAGFQNRHALQLNAVRLINDMGGKKRLAASRLLLARDTREKFTSSMEDLLESARSQSARDSDTPPLEEVYAKMLAMQSEVPNLSLPIVTDTDNAPKRTKRQASAATPSPVKKKGLSNKRTAACRRIRVSVRSTSRRESPPPISHSITQAATEMSASSEGSLEQVTRISAFTPRTKRSKRIIYPIFADCIESTDDVEWKEHLSEAASGKLHNATFVRKILKYKGKESKELTVENLGSIPQVLDEIVNFFQQKMCICFTEVDKLKSESMEGVPFNPQTLGELNNKKAFQCI